MSLIILDRDGVINHDSDDFIKNPAEWEPIEGSLEAIARLNYAGYRVVVITNQSGIARGLFDVETLNRIHSKMRRMLAQVGGKIEAIMFCPHGPEDDCQCRKPQNGSFVDLAHRYE
jgi:D-glycero-D-manno-heptose 1,7-bisphosphate phosphatase